jgi:RNA binding exosome subunit
MNVEKILDVCFKLFLSDAEKKRLKVIADTFYHGNPCAALAEVIEDGIMIAESVKEMLEDVTHQADITQRFCETQLDKVHDRWKGKKDEANSKDE